MLLAFKFVKLVEGSMNEFWSIEGGLDIPVFGTVSMVLYIELVEKQAHSMVKIII